MPNILHAITNGSSPSPQPRELLAKKKEERPMRYQPFTAVLLGNLVVLQIATSQRLGSILRFSRHNYVGTVGPTRVGTLSERLLICVSFL
jgi:hypothetical protein